MIWRTRNWRTAADARFDTSDVAATDEDEEKAGEPALGAKAVADALDGFLADSRPTRCEYIERNRFKHFVGDCYRADGQSVAPGLVRNGHALDWPLYSKGAYAGEQAMAKADRRGMWQDDLLALGSAETAR